ncbi:CDP-alcohol phosphatidyltransferase family protein [Candidatus Woesearchaeota archaeon]|nr:CDP-alcohol phosphatidyltransferase family protein [Candidatus Woesearchaeota archaeon]
MNLTSYRHIFKKIYYPVAKVLGRMGITPNFITLMAFALGLVAAYLYFKQMVLWALVMLVLSGIFDLMDGAVAVIYRKASKFGSVFDWFADKIVDGCLLGVVGFVYANPLVALIAVVVNMTHSFIKPTAYAEIGFGTRKKGKIIDPLEGIGFFGRPETVITLGVFSILHLFRIPYLDLTTGIYLIAVLTTLSLLWRMIYLYRKFNKVSDN